MADRTSAALFASLFERLAAGKTLDAQTLWEMQGRYDFAPQQMGCNDALQKLGLMRICDRKDVNEDVCGAIYGPIPSTCDGCGETGPFNTKEGSAR